MFSDTIFNNIAYSDPDATVEDVIHAADVANAHGFIARQPDAYDTVLGERGVGVSGGEKQRISIARAVLKSPSILIFDEATAAVDSETEHLIQEAIDRLIAGKTTLMIAHRLSTLRRANRILVVDGGRIVGLLLTTAVESVTRKKIDPKYEGYIHAAGMIALLALMALITFKDIFTIIKR